jgi:hypothetical protein
LTLAAPLAAAGAAWTLLRKRERDAADPTRVRSRRAHAKFRASDRGAAAFTTYLAERLGCAEAAVVHDELEALLTRRGIGPDLARRAANELLTAVSARYAGGAAAAPAEFGPLADSLEGDFSKAEVSA